jgi:hypothetical protein
LFQSDEGFWLLQGGSSAGNSMNLRTINLGLVLEGLVREPIVVE